MIVVMFLRIRIDGQMIWNMFAVIVCHNFLLIVRMIDACRVVIVMSVNVVYVVISVVMCVLRVEPEKKLKN